MSNERQKFWNWPRTKTLRVGLQAASVALVLLAGGPALADGTSLFERGRRAIDPDRPWYAEVGLDLALAPHPTQTDAPVAFGTTIVAGYWFNGWVAGELAVSYTGGNDRLGDEGLGGMQHQTSMRAGVRGAIPFVISPVAAVHLGYERGEGSWAYGPREGVDVRHALTLDAAAGLQVTYRWFTASALVHARLNLAASSSRDEVRTHGAGSLEVAELTVPELMDLLLFGFEARVGVRF